MSPFPRIIVNDKIDAGKKNIAEKQHGYDCYSDKNNKTVIGRKIKISIYPV
jgi:hypothetical protein